MADEGQEKDYLRYTGNKIPRVIRLAWTLFFIFGAGYLAVYMWPDLTQWLSK